MEAGHLGRVGLHLDDAYSSAGPIVIEATASTYVQKENAFHAEPSAVGSATVVTNNASGTPSFQKILKRGRDSASAVCGP